MAGQKATGQKSIHIKDPRTKGHKWGIVEIGTGKVWKRVWLDWRSEVLEGGVHRGLTNAPHVKQFLHFKSQILLLIHGRPIVAHCQCGTQLHMLEFLLNVGNFVNKLLTASGIVLVVLIFGAISLDINKPWWWFSAESTVKLWSLCLVVVVILSVMSFKIQTKPRV